MERRLLAWHENSCNESAQLHNIAFIAAILNHLKNSRCTKSRIFFQYLPNGISIWIGYARPN